MLAPGRWPYSKDPFSWQKPDAVAASLLLRGLLLALTVSSWTVVSAGLASFVANPAGDQLEACEADRAKGTLQVEWDARFCGTQHMQ